MYYYLACPHCDEEVDSPEWGVYHCQECNRYVTPDQVMVTGVEVPSGDTKQ